MQTIDTSAENFKSSPLGFLMSVMAKYQAYMQKHYDNSNNQNSLKTVQNMGDILDNMKIELSKTESLKQETSNEAVMIHVVENCEPEEREVILESVFEYLSLLDTSLQAIDTNSEDGKILVTEYYNVSRLGLLLNCYLGTFENDDFYYGTFAEMAETYKTNNSINSDLTAACDMIISKVEKADINLKFKKFIKQIYDSLDDSSKNQIYEKIIQPYADSLLEKVLTQEVSEEELNRLACAKQLQRIYEKLFYR